MSRRRGNQHLQNKRKRDRKRREREKLNPKPEQTEVPEKLKPTKLKKESRTKKLFGWIKKHVRPDIGLSPFKEGEGPDFKNDDLHDISGKLKENLKIGLKITWKF